MPSTVRRPTLHCVSKKVPFWFSQRTLRREKIKIRHVMQAIMMQDQICNIMFDTIKRVWQDLVKPTGGHYEHSV